MEGHKELEGESVLDLDNKKDTCLSSQRDATRVFESEGVEHVLSRECTRFSNHNLLKAQAHPNPVPPDLAADVQLLQIDQNLKFPAMLRSHEAQETRHTVPCTNVLVRVRHQRS